MKLNCFILRTTTVAGLGVPIFRVFTVNWVKMTVLDGCYLQLLKGAKKQKQKKNLT